MRLLTGTLVAAATLVTAFTTLSAEAKERGPVRVCGSSGCRIVSSLELQVTDRYYWLKAPAPAPFYVVHAVWRTFIPGFRRPIVYLPQQAIWRVRLRGTFLWLEVPQSAQFTLQHSVSQMTPCRASSTWRCARR